MISSSEIMITSLIVKWNLSNPIIALHFQFTSHCKGEIIFFLFIYLYQYRFIDFYFIQEVKFLIFIICIDVQCAFRNLFKVAPVFLTCFHPQLSISLLPCIRKALSHFSFFLLQLQYHEFFPQKVLNSFYWRMIF